MVKTPEEKKQELPDRKEVEDMAAKYKHQLISKLNPEENISEMSQQIYTKEYLDFKREYIQKKMGWYENACNFTEKLVKLNPPEKLENQLTEHIRVSHLDVTPSGVYAFSMLTPIVVMIVGVFLGYMLPIFTGTESGSLFVMGLSVLVALLMYVGFGKLPKFFADSWRMKASNQMVLCVFYVVTFMRHTSNLELAIRFASDHLGPPLSLDMKKILWDVETEKYDSIKESLDAYLDTWKKYNMEFIEAFHLIESSLYESSEERRIEMLDKSLDVILSETYEKMLHYAHNLKSPITMIHMVGVILPILLLVILPLAINFMQDDAGNSVIKWYHIAAGYNFLLPVGVYFLGKSILSNRPTGYGSTNIEDPDNKGKKTITFNILGANIEIDPLFLSLSVFLLFLFIGVSPLLMNFMGMQDIPLSPNDDFSTSCQKQFCLLEYKEVDIDGVTKEVGPFGLGATILSIFITLSLSVSIGLYYHLKSRNVVEIRKKTKKLEAEFASALFQLGNRIGDGLPAEIAFGRVAQIMEGSESGKFFNIVSSNVRRLGMSVENAIFNEKTGGLVYFPSNVIESSMKVLTQSIKKGPKVAAQALVNVSRYIKEIHTVNERLQDLMGDVISSMKSQINFLTPVIGGIVIGITSMISNIMGKLGASQQRLQASVGEGSGSLGGLGSLLSGTGIPTYYFQAIVGIYVVQIIYILTVLSNGIENGEDKTAEHDAIGQNMLKSVTLYCIIAGVVIIAFNLLASQIIKVVGP